MGEKPEVDEMGVPRRGPSELDNRTFKYLPEEEAGEGLREALERASAALPYNDELKKWTPEQIAQSVKSARRHIDTALSNSTPGLSEEHRANTRAAEYEASEGKYGAPIEISDQEDAEWLRSQSVPRESDSTSPERCTCIWAGKVRADSGPNEIDPNCPVHADSRQEENTG